MQTTATMDETRNDRWKENYECDREDVQLAP